MDILPGDVKLAEAGHKIMRGKINDANRYGIINICNQIKNMIDHFFYGDYSKLYKQYKNLNKFEYPYINGFPLSENENKGASFIKGDYRYRWSDKFNYQRLNFDFLKGEQTRWIVGSTNWNKGIKKFNPKYTFFIP